MLLGVIEGIEAGEAAAAPWPNTRSNVEVVKPQIFNGEASKISRFLIVCKLYIRMRISEVVVKEQM